MKAFPDYSKANEHPKKDLLQKYSKILSLHGREPVSMNKTPYFEKSLIENTENEPLLEVENSGNHIDNGLTSNTTLGSYYFKDDKIINRKKSLKTLNHSELFTTQGKGFKHQNLSELDKIRGNMTLHEVYRKPTRKESQKIIGNLEEFIKIVDNQTSIHEKLDLLDSVVPPSEISKNPLKRKHNIFPLKLMEMSSKSASKLNEILNKDAKKGSSLLKENYDNSHFLMEPLRDSKDIDSRSKKFANNSASDSVDSSVPQLSSILSERVGKPTAEAAHPDRKKILSLEQWMKTKLEGLDIKDPGKSDEILLEKSAKIHKIYAVCMNQILSDIEKEFKERSTFLRKIWADSIHILSRVIIVQHGQLLNKERDYLNREKALHKLYQDTISNKHQEQISMKQEIEQISKSLQKTLGAVKSVRKREFLQRKRISDLNETIKILCRENDNLVLDNMKMAMANHDLDIIEIRKIYLRYEDSLRQKFDLLRKNGKPISLNKFFKQESTRTRKFSSPIEESYDTKDSGFELSKLIELLFEIEIDRDIIEPNVQPERIMEELDPIENLKMIDAETNTFIQPKKIFFNKETETSELIICKSQGTDPEVETELQVKEREIIDTPLVKERSEAETQTDALIMTDLLKPIKAEETKQKKMNVNFEKSPKKLSLQKPNNSIQEKRFSTFTGFPNGSSSALLPKRLGGQSLKNPVIISNETPTESSEEEDDVVEKMPNPTSAKTISLFGIKPRASVRVLK